MGASPRSAQVGKPFSPISVRSSFKNVMLFPRLVLRNFCAIKPGKRIASNIVKMLGSADWLNGQMASIVVNKSSTNISIKTIISDLEEAKLDNLDCIINHAIEETM